MEFNTADLFEQAVDQWRDRECLVIDGRRRTYAQLEARANRLAHHLATDGVGPGDHVGIYGSNSVEWVEAMWAVAKLRAVWVNINFRYVEDELAYLFGIANLDALVFDECYAERTLAVRDSLTPDVRFVVIGNGSSEAALALGAVPFEAALAGQSADRDFEPRSGDDHYLLFTGGTTGMPKGVLWRNEDVVMSLGGGVDVVSGERATRPEDLLDRGYPEPMVYLALPPLMHAAGHWGLMIQAFTGNKVVMTGKFDASEVWHSIQRERVNVMSITGNAMAQPLLDALKTIEAGEAPLELSSLLAVTSTAVLFSQHLKDELAERLPNLIITDAIGSSETGAAGITMVAKGTSMKGGPNVNAVADTFVLDDNLEPLAAGSGAIGRLARAGHIPLGYYNDPMKTAETFLTGPSGIRYSVPGDFATVEADGTITLLGRGSGCINSGGEKIFPEEVETAVASHPDVYDVLVVGVPDERWGDQVVAVVQARQGKQPTVEAIGDHAGQFIARYKLPRRVVLVEQIERAPSGKPDYRWAAMMAGRAGDGEAARPVAPLLDTATPAPAAT